jgi:hypothetical protein
VSHSSGPRLHAREDFSAATCRTAPDPASLLERALVLSRVTWLWTPPPARVGFGAVTCHTASNPASLFGRALMLPRITRLQTPPSYSGGLRCYHEPHSSGPCLPARGVGASSAVTCPMTFRGQRALRIKKGLAITACSKTHMFPRHARVLPRRLQDVWADGVIMTYKPCGPALQYRATMQRHASDHP